MVTISGSTLRSNVFETVYDLLTAANLLSSTVSVYGGYPDTDNIAFPIVVVNRVSVSKDDPTFDRSSFMNDIMVQIEVYAKKNKHIDQISDQIDALSGLKTIPGLMLTRWEESDAYTPENDNKVHMRTISLFYRRR